MHTYKITWKLLSGISTPLQSDTIFGHLCWAIRYLWGEAELLKLIEALKENPVFVLSSAFPGGQLPKPAIPLASSALEANRALLCQDPRFKDELSDLDISLVHKKMKKAKTICLKSLEQAGFVYDIPKLMNQESLYIAEKLLGKKKGNLPNLPPEHAQATEFHNKIDRASGTTNGSGELFASTVSYYRDPCFSSWLDTDFYSQEQLSELFGFIALHGFGKDKNTGKGRFEISLETYAWQNCKDFNAYLNLSNMLPSAADSILASYQGNTKFAKIGGDYATTQTPFKYPVYIIGPGAVFFAGENGMPPRGCLLRDVHPNPDIVQNLYSYSLPLLIKECIK